MGFFKNILLFLKGKQHAGGTEKSVFGRSGRERRVLHQVYAAVERAISDFRGIRMLETACADERSRNFGAVPSDQVREESSILIAAAKRVGCFVNAKDVPGTKYTIRSGESEVRLVQKDRVYFKIKNPFAKSHLKKHPERFALYEHIIHNILFPECVLDFIGVSEDFHEVRLVYRQNAVRSVDRPDDQTISQYLEMFGLHPAERYCFGNDYLFVTDIGQDSDNVLQDADGNLFFIDPIIGFRKPLCELLDSLNGSEELVKSLVYEVYGITRDEQSLIDIAGSTLV